MTDAHTIGAGWPPCPCCTVRPQMHRVGLSLWECPKCQAAMNDVALDWAEEVRQYSDGEWGAEDDDIWAAAQFEMLKYDGPQSWRLTDE